MDDKVLFYEMTYELQNHWTILLHRDKGARLLESVKRRITDDTEIIVLDFSMVTAVDKSFIDAFLCPLYRDVGESKVILGINIAPKIVKEDLLRKDINKVLRDWRITWLVIDTDSIPYLLGAKDDIGSKILNILWKEGDQTLEQLAFRLDLNKKKIKEQLKYLRMLRLINQGQSLARGYLYYNARYVEFIKPKIGRTIADTVMDKMRVQRIDEDGHFELPSGVHVEKFYRLSKVLMDPRLTRAVGNHFALLFSDLNPSYILTVETPNNILLSHRVAQSMGMGTKSIFGKIHPHEKSLVLHEGFDIKKDERGLIVIDTVVTGFIIQLLINLVNRIGGTLIGICSLLDLSSGQLFPPHKYYSLIQESAKVFVQHNCPLCKAGVPLSQPKIMPGDWKW